VNFIVPVRAGTSSQSFGNIGIQDYTKIQDGVDSILTRLRPGQAIIGGRDFYLVQIIWTGLGLRCCCLMGRGVKAAIMWRYNCALAPRNFFLRYRRNVLFLGVLVHGTLHVCGIMELLASSSN